jgi:hypothetical protein
MGEWGREGSEPKSSLWCGNSGQGSWTLLGCGPLSGISRDRPFLGSGDGGVERIQAPVLRELKPALLTRDTRRMTRKTYSVGVQSVADPDKLKLPPLVGISHRFS